MAKEKNSVKILEKGNLYFFYRPKIEKPSPKKSKDISRLYMILSPFRKRSFRLLIVGQKELPRIKGDRRNWAFVYKVSNHVKEIEGELHEEKYKTKTRGERKTPVSRPAGEGIYAIVFHKNHTHFIYNLELPNRIGEVQKEFNIKQQGNFITTIKNPEKPSPMRAGLAHKQKAKFTKDLQNKFQGKQFYNLNPDFLDYQDAELIFIETGKKIYEDLGVKLNPKEETESSAEIFNELKLERDKHPLKPLFKGKWE
ncbi:MAG: hypothetical protein ACOYT4_02525 [Nanoarchaeota archaeon]